MAKGIHWIAGPIGYDGNRGSHFNTDPQNLEWVFIGGTAAGEIRRWALRYVVESRSFTVNVRKTSQWDQSHSSDLATFYRPMAVLRHLLPKGSIVTALRSMLPAKEIAAATALSISGKHQ